MKCIHCSCLVDRCEWFCPNCKRSVPRRRQPRYGWAGISACVVLAATVGGLAVVRNMANRPADPAPQEEAPLTRVRITPAPDALPALPAFQPQIAGLVLAGVAPAAERLEPASTPALPPFQAMAVRAEHAPVPLPAPSGTGTVTVRSEGPEETYVYLNGGALLGMAPLVDVPIRAGRHTLLFWTPSIGGRASRVVNVEPGQMLEVTESVSPRGSFQ